jgi:squalene-associated FAD-dependent desaturase
MQLQRWNKILESRLAGLTVDAWLRSMHQSDESLRCFWYPIAFSVMNEQPGCASALLFARAIRMTFLGKKSDSAILIPSIGQSDLYVTGIERHLSESGVSVFLNSEVRAIKSKEMEVESILLENGETLCADYTICAVPYHRLGRMVPPQWKHLSPFCNLHKFTSSPIVSIHLWFEHDFMEMEFAGVIGGSIQWIFNRRRITGRSSGTGGYISCIISAARAFVTRSREELVELALEDIHRIFPGSRFVRLTHSLVLKEKRATFSPTIEVEQFRPDTRTGLDHLFLAGDWTNTGLPATIEGAVSSGFAAARAVLTS